MKLTIKTLDLKTFHVDFDETQTVWALKEHLWELPEVAVKPEQQQLIYAGRILSNEHELKFYSIDERKFLVVMAKKSGGEVSDQPGPSCPVPKSRKIAIETVTSETVTSETGTSEIATSETGTPPNTNTEPPPNTNTAPKPAVADEGGAQSNTNVEESPISATNDLMVQNIMGMGYPEADVRRALLASFNNPNRAIEYLIEGIPNIPDIMIPAGANSGNSTTSTQNPLSFLRTDPRFAQMRRVIQQRPASLSTVLAKIGETNPALLALIRDHQEEFISMLNDPDDNTEDITQAEEEVIAVILTEAERSAVDRLAALGFPRELVIQAYIACEKNEEQTADFLCRHLDEET